MTNRLRLLMGVLSINGKFLTVSAADIRAYQCALDVLHNIWQLCRVWRDWKTLNIMSYGFKLIQEAGLFFVHWQNQEILGVSCTPSVQFCIHNSPPPVQIPRHTYQVHIHSLLWDTFQYFSLPFIAFPLSRAVFTVSGFVAHLRFSFLFFFVTTLELKQLKFVSVQIFLNDVLCCMKHENIRKQRDDVWPKYQFRNLNQMQCLLNFV